MSAQNQLIFRDLIEEAKKRIVFLLICVVGLSYLMSLTSSSVLVNLPAAAALVVFFRYLSLDFDLRKKAAAKSSKQSSDNVLSVNKPPERPKIVDKSDWRRKVNSPIVEDAIDHFTRHLISEWVTDLWYSRLTPDKEGPEELVNIVNSALAEIAGRLRNINLIDLLTRDLINLMITHLEHFRSAQARIEKQRLASLTFEQRDLELMRILAAENKLHPALFSAESQHKVLQHLMEGFIRLILRSEDLQCQYFRCTARELLASAVMRPILNLASPRFINERIEVLVMNIRKAKKTAGSAPEAFQSKPDGSSKISSDHFSKVVDPTATGVELVQLKKPSSAADTTAKDNTNGNLSKDPLLSVDTRSSRSWNSLPLNSKVTDQKAIQQLGSGGEWAEKLERFSRRKTQALAPEHFENMWAKGKNYKKRDSENKLNEQAQQFSPAEKPVMSDDVKTVSKTIAKNPTQSNTSSAGDDQLIVGCSSLPNELKVSNGSSDVYGKEEDERGVMKLEEIDSESYTSYSTEDEESSNVTGLDSPVTKVWDGRSNRNLGASYIRHPLENFDGIPGRKRVKGRIHYRILPRKQAGRKRSRPSNQNVHVWQEVERTSFLSGDGQDLLSSSIGLANDEDSSDDYEVESLRRVHSGAAASSSAPSTGTENLAISPAENSLAVDSFYRLRCEVLGANIVKSGSRNFAVYSISVTDVNNNSWSVKRRFRHFEELHRHLKEFPDYNLHLPPKHFLSTGLDVPVIQERCLLLDKYLKRLMQIPKISGSIEVWDFLSVDSQTYIFSNSFSIIKTFSVDLLDKPAENNTKLSNNLGPATGPSSLRKGCTGAEIKGSSLQMKNNLRSNASRMNTEDSGTQKAASSFRGSERTSQGREGGNLTEASDTLLDSATDPTLPTEWIPPNLSVPILDLVDVVFQLQDGGWIRRKAFWVAKQALQLGMGDAFDDWLLEKIQLLRKGSVIAAVIKRAEQLLWPDGIFISKHPKRRPPSVSPSQGSPYGREPTEMLSPRLTDEQRAEAERRAKFVYELMVDNAPAAIVGLVGRKEYEQCAKDLYFFLQSTVFLKQLAFDLAELLLLSAFPELDYVFKELHQEKHKFGEYKAE